MTSGRSRVLARWFSGAAGVCVVWGLALAGGAGAEASNCVTSGTTTTCSYASTGQEQQLVVPADVTGIHVTAVGAPGGAGAPSSGFDQVIFAGLGGYGAVVSGTVPVTPNETIDVEVGGPGQASNGSTVALGGFNGGGNGGQITGASWLGSGGGGGASDIRTVSCGSPCNAEGSASLASRLLVAGGGGGGGSGALEEYGGKGGSGGTTPAAGVNGQGLLERGSDTVTVPGSDGGGGGAGTSTQGGTGGSGGDEDDINPASPGSNGALGSGGSALAPEPFDDIQAPGGGGGGGAYGGGGGGSGWFDAPESGAGGGGGAGSNFAAPSVSGEAISTDTSGTPSVTISYSPAPAPAVTTGATSGVMTSSATLLGTVDPDGLPAQYHFQFGPTTSYGGSSASLNAGSGTTAVDVKAMITGLKPGTTYHYRLVATSASGTSDGGDRTFTTPKRASISVSPRKVRAGERVRVFGNAETCPSGDRMTLRSKAFSDRHRSAGMPAVLTTVKAQGAYSVRTTIPRSRHGRYSITAGCGGASLGVKAILSVRKP